MQAGARYIIQRQTVVGRCGRDGAGGAVGPRGGPGRRGDRSRPREIPRRPQGLQGVGSHARPLRAGHFTTASSVGTKGSGLSSTPLLCRSQRWASPYTCRRDRHRDELARVPPPRSTKRASPSTPTAGRRGCRRDQIAQVTGPIANIDGKDLAGAERLVRPPAGVSRRRAGPAGGRRWIRPLGRQVLDRTVLEDHLRHSYEGGRSLRHSTPDLLGRECGQGRPLGARGGGERSDVRPRPREIRR